ncbi:hypothetical protein PCCS19_17380 [Paenibacillus sp. CCS19]|jgi:hypothetical protein|uniref:hypothetical protein n=1 Tax=Paenibacillus sp. CCS19 TaxID=3158387 RepID=UPI00255EC139|nr:hypothetical protein [Paenibacillus cellulosilyticus]GMK38684.1 hypothetical protein PCCS19_17380 [Paenibacillus cellulosilyticus]
MISKSIRTYLLLLLALILCIIAVVYYQTKSTSSKAFANVYHVESDHKVYGNSGELAADADLIVRVKATASSRNVNQQMDENGVPLWFWTETEVEVTKVYKSNEKIEKGQKITLYEPYSIFEDSKKSRNQIIKDHYKPVNAGEKYLLFLKKHADGGYMPLGVDQGKINQSEPVDKDNAVLSEDALNQYRDE